MNRTSSTPLRSGSSPDLRNAGRAKSCTRCRQAKIACDARRTVNGRCSRCESKKLDCRFDANFKRVSTRKLTDEISHGLHALRSTEQSHVSESLTLKPIQMVGMDRNSVPSDVRQQSPVAEVMISEPPQMDPWVDITDVDRSRSYTLGKLTLESQTIIDLFQHFGVHYYPYAIFLPPHASPLELETRSPLLFWTIILVASQDHTRFATIYPQVATEHEGLLSLILLRAIQHLETIHALLLLCLWPIPQARHFSNPAWNYVGLVINAALQLNCHSPTGPRSETHGWKGGDVAVYELSAQDQARTWLGCFWVGNVIAAFYGLPPPMSTQMRSIDRELDTILSIPPWWRTLFCIMKITNSVMDTLGGIEDHALHFSLTQMFDRQLDELKKSNNALWRSKLEIEWCNAKLYLYALTFTLPTSSTPSFNTQMQIHRQEILYKALEAASRLITELTILGQQCTSDLYPGGLLSFLPKPYFTALFNATTFLFRFMATYITRTPAQEIRAMACTVEAHTIFQSFPKQRELTRAAIHIETLIDILRENNPGVNINELAVKNKLGASVMFDAVFHACRQRNRDSRTGKALAVSEWKTLNETFAQRLPPAPIQKTGDGYGTLGVGTSEFDSLDQSLIDEVQNPQWWGEWESYMKLFQVGAEQWDAEGVDISMNGELGGFAFT